MQQGAHLTPLPAAQTTHTYASDISTAMALPPGRADAAAEAAGTSAAAATKAAADAKALEKCTGA